LSIAWSFPEIFAIKVYSCLKSRSLHNSWTAALTLMKFCRNMYLHNRPTPGEFQGHRSKVKVTWVFGCFSVCMMHYWCFGYPWTVLSLEQGLIMSFSRKTSWGRLVCGGHVGALLDPAFTLCAVRPRTTLIASPRWPHWRLFPVRRQPRDLNAAADCWLVPKCHVTDCKQCSP